MARRRRHPIDLLPLLDVFMVVLFVFATIQEQRLDDTARDAQALEHELARAEQALRAAQAREQAHARDHEAAETEDDRTAAALASAQREAQALRAELGRLRRGIETEHTETRAALARMGLPEATLQRLDLLSMLLDKHGVVEIELIGRPGQDGLPRNHCCYRVDPLSEQWRACGEVPRLLEDRERWLDEGANGLAEALRRTKGGNAMTLVRQDPAASHDIASNLAKLLRTRFSDQYVDFAEVPVLTARCDE